MFTRNCKRRLVMSGVKVLMVTLIALMLSVHSLASVPKTLVVGWDGAVPHFVNRYEAEGVLPTITRLMKHGSYSQNGILPVIPSITGAAWPAILAGANSGTTGITNGIFHDVRTPITQSGWSDPPFMMAETLPQVSERVGMRTAVLGGAWSSWPPAEAGLTGPAMGWGNWHSEPLVMSNYDIPNAEVAPYLFMTYRKFDFDHKVSLPDNLISYSEPQVFQLNLTTYSQEDLIWEVAAIDTTDDNVENYDRLIFFSDDQTEGLSVVGSVGLGEWMELRAKVDGTTAGTYVKVLDLDPNLEKVRLYATAMQSVQAFPVWLEKEMVEQVSAPCRASYDAIMGGFVDEQTFLEEVLIGVRATAEAYNYVIEKTEPDLVFAWFSEPDEIGHRMVGYLDPDSPFYEAEKVGYRNNMMRQTYQALDWATGKLWKAIGGPEKSTMFVTSDHGMVSVWKIANVNELLAVNGIYNSADPSNSRAIAYSSGGATQVYINLEGREPGGIVPAEEYADLQKAIVDLLENWKDSDGERIMAKVLPKEETKRIVVDERTFHMYNEYTTGDVVAFSVPPYQFDAAMPQMVVSPSIPYFSGQHGFLADTVPTQRGTVRPIFLAGGRGIKAGADIPETMASIDIAPTISRMLNIPTPKQNEGEVITDLLLFDTVTDSIAQ